MTYTSSISRAVMLIYVVVLYTSVSLKLKPKIQDSTASPIAHLGGVSSPSEHPQASLQVPRTNSSTLTPASK